MLNDAETMHLMKWGSNSGICLRHLEKKVMMVWSNGIVQHQNTSTNPGSLAMTKLNHQICCFTPTPLGSLGFSEVLRSRCQDDLDGSLGCRVRSSAIQKYWTWEYLVFSSQFLIEKMVVMLTLDHQSVLCWIMYIILVFCLSMNLGCIHGFAFQTPGQK